MIQPYEAELKLHPATSVETQLTNRKHNMLSNHFGNLSSDFSSNVVVGI
jgi:hypothetical protein